MDGQARLKVDGHSNWTFSVDFRAEIKSPFWLSFRGFSPIFDEQAFNLGYRMIHFWVIFKSETGNID